MPAQDKNKLAVTTEQVILVVNKRAQKYHTTHGNSRLL